jgi:hypothetical protein
MIELHIDECTKNVETCPVVKQIFDIDAFESLIESIDGNAKMRRKILGDFVTACVNANCPGQEPELTKQIISRFRKY